MKTSFKHRVILRQARQLGTRALELRRELRDHYRAEFSRIRLAEKRARGLRLYVAWSRRSDPVTAEPRPAPAWQSAESAA